MRYEYYYLSFYYSMNTMIALTHQLYIVICSHDGLCYKLQYDNAHDL